MKNKYTYWVVLQQNGGYGWDDVEHFDQRASTVIERKRVLKEYRDNMPKCSYRFIKRRELNK